MGFGILKSGGSSENKEILHAGDQVAPFGAPDAILLFEHGGDRIEWMAVSFLYTRLKSVALKISALPELTFVNRRNPNDLLRFKFDKLAAAVKRIVSGARLDETTAFPHAARQMLFTVNRC